MGKTGPVGRRIARIKLVPFTEALIKVAPFLELPARLPYKLACPLPDHNDKTPSCFIQEKRWWCYGCGRGGDVVDFAQLYHVVDVVKAVQIVESALGLTDRGDHDLAALITLARRGAEVEGLDLTEWLAAVTEIEDTFLERVGPFLRCNDLHVVLTAQPQAEYVFGVLADHGARRPPRTLRGAYDDLRHLRRWTLEHAAGIAADVLRVTGKDLVDVATQGGWRPSLPRAVREEAGRMLVELSKERQQQAKASTPAKKDPRGDKVGFATRSRAWDATPP